MRFSHLESSELTDTGKHRSNNEDAALRLPGSGVFCVADGMGGAADGDLASRTVVDAIDEAFSGRHSDGEPDFERVKQLIREAALNANAWIKEYAEDRGSGGMGTTLVVLAFDPVAPGNAVVMHAGDSRAYRLRGDTLTRLTRDHSLVSDAGLDDRESLGPMFRAMVTRAVGIRADVDLEETPVDVAENDLFLLCSDGLTAMVCDEELALILRENRGLDADGICRLLVDKSNRKGGEDNITVLLVRAGKFPEAVEREAVGVAVQEAGELTLTGDDQAIEGPEEDTGPEERDTTPPSDSGDSLVTAGHEPPVPTSDLECVTPTVADAEKTTDPDSRQGAAPAGAAPPEFPAPKPPSPGLWIAVAVFGLAVVVAVWKLAMPAEPRHETRSRQKEMTQVLAGTRPEDLMKQSDRDALSAAFAARLDETLQTGEWGSMAGHLGDWSKSVPDLLARSGKAPLYGSWVMLWTRIRNGETDAVPFYRGYRDEVAAICRKAGFDLPLDESSEIAVEPAELQADTVCRLMYRLQKHLVENVRNAVRQCGAEMEVFGPVPSQSLAGLWSFAGGSDGRSLATCVARAGRIANDTDRLDKWLAACGDGQIPLPSIKMVPATIVPRLLTNVREQRKAVARQMATIPSRVKALHETARADLIPTLDRIDGVYEKALGGKRASDAAVWQGAESGKALRALLDEVRNAAEIVGKQETGRGR